MKKALTVLAVALAVLAAVVAVRFARFTPRQPPPPAAAVTAPNPAAVAERLAQAIRFETVSHQDRSDDDPEAFLGLHGFLAASYPRVHAELEVETVSGRSLLFTWRGEEPELAPVALLAHLDVVPIAPGTEGDWVHPPFAGAVADGYVWGRGALDDKASVVTLLEAVETLLGEGFRPRRTVLLAFGHDEEVGGAQGAGEIAELLTARHGELAMVLDEGSVIVTGLPGLETRPVALIGIAEKGFLSLELTVEGAGGHSSMPPPATAVGILSRAVARVQDAPFPARIDGATRAMLERLGPEYPPFRRLLVANLWLFEPLVGRSMAADPTTAAMVRTTTAPTMLAAGVKDNVLPQRARAVVNFRILPGDTVESVTERVRGIVDDDRVEIEALPWRAEPSPVSDPDSDAFRYVAAAVQRVERAPDLLVAPFLVLAGTDAKYYAGRSPNVFRFLPIGLERADIARIHGTNERVGLEDLARAVAFYRELVAGLADADL